VRQAARSAALLATLAGGVQASIACNAILGNEKRTLGDEEGGTVRPDADKPPDAGGSDGTCGAALASDPKNCGACGHDCLGGACNHGKCAPFVLATNQKQPSNPVVDEGTIYWTNGDGTIWSCATAGCNGRPRPITAIEAGNTFLSGLDVKNGVVLATGYYSQALHTCPTTGCAQPTTLIGNLDYPVAGLLDGKDGAFFINANRASVERCSLPSCAGGPTRIAGGPPAWRRLAQDETKVYWTAAGPPPSDYSKAIVYRAPKTQVDGGPETILSNVSFPTAITVRNDVLYMALGGGTITKVSLGTGLLQFDLVNGESKPSGVAIDETYVYWTTSGNGAIRRCAAAGCEGKPETIIDGQNEPYGPVVTSDAIYWTEYLGGTVKGIAK
jgi:hypothetical protein